MPFDIQSIIKRLQIDQAAADRPTSLCFDTEDYNGLFHYSHVSNVISVLRPHVAPGMIAEVCISRKDEGGWLNEFEISHGLSYLSPDQPQYSLAHDSLAKAKEIENQDFNSALNLIGITQEHNLAPD